MHFVQEKDAHFGGIRVECYGQNCAPSKFIVEVLAPVFQNVAVFEGGCSRGDRAK